MTSQLANMVRQVSASVGNGNLTLATNTNGYQTFDQAFGHGASINVFYYFISNSNAVEWEYGTGHMSNSTTLVRDTVVLSSNSNSAVSFTAAGGQLSIVNCPPQSLLTLLESITGSGALVCQSGAILIGPQLGTPGGGILSNCTGYNTTNVVATLATTSGTTVTWSVPSAARRIILSMNGVSTTSTSAFQIRLGTAGGGIIASGYTALQSGSANTTYSTGFGWPSVAATSYYGNVYFELENASANTWVCSGAAFLSTAGAYTLGGSITLSSPISSIQITTVLGTPTFDAGEACVSWTL